MTSISAVSSIAASALSAAQMRLEASATNVANAQSGGAAPGQAQGAAAPGRPRTTFRPVTADQTSLAGGGVKVDLRMVQPGYFMAYAPSSPDADKDGMEAMPDVDPGAEAVNQIEARRQYEANLRVIQTANQMQGSALKIDL